MADYIDETLFPITPTRHSINSNETRGKTELATTDRQLQIEHQQNICSTRTFWLVCLYFSCSALPLLLLYSKFWLVWLIFQLFFTTTTTGLSWFQYGYDCDNSPLPSIAQGTGNLYCTFNCVFTALSTMALLLTVLEIVIQIVIMTHRDTQSKIIAGQCKYITISLISCAIHFFYYLIVLICFTMKLLNYIKIQDTTTYTGSDVTVFIDSVLFGMTCIMTITFLGLIIAIIFSIYICVVYYSCYMVFKACVENFRMISL